MLRTLLLASAFAVCAVAPAVAAPAENWSGFYAGVNAGLGGDKFEYPVGGTFTPSDGETAPTTVTGKLQQSSSGFVGGAQIGYNWEETNGGWVLGAEADIDYADIKGNLSFSGTGAQALLGVNGHLSSKFDYVGTLRARAGMAMAEGRFMPYIAGGLAFGGVKSNASLEVTPDLVVNPLGTGTTTVLTASQSDNRTGWTIGVGADYAIADNVSFRAEYLYVDLGTHNGFSGPIQTPGGAISGAVGLKATANIVRVGVNWRFGGL